MVILRSLMQEREDAILFVYEGICFCGEPAVFCFVLFPFSNYLYKSAQGI